ncbi:MAG: hypothetical protein HC850_03510 [Rhodomicrobium sp.]|nr:hypothetical protein [Rhodomicrobium sp.]
MRAWFKLTAGAATPGLARPPARAGETGPNPATPLAAPIGRPRLVSSTAATG